MLEHSYLRPLNAASIALAAGLALSPLLMGCSSPRPVRTPTADAPAANGPSLAELAEKETQNPVASAAGLAPPPGVDAGAVAPLPPEALTPGAEAVRPLAEVIAAMPRPKPAEQTERSADMEALKLYASAREKLLAGRAAAAVPDLEAASKLDPASPSIWRELGEAQLDLGRRSGAVTSFQKAVSLGLSEPRVYWLLGRESNRARRFEEGSRLLVRAKELASGPGDSALRILINADLAESMQSLGHTGAARDALIESLREPLPPFVGARFRTELGEIYRRRGELWQRVGDYSCQLGQYQVAAEAYAQLRELPTLDPGAALSRQVHALLKLGRPASATLEVLDDIRRNDGRLEDRHLQLLRFLRETGTGPAAGAAIAAMGNELKATATPTVLRELARAAAAVAGRGEGREILRSYVLTHPSETDVLRDAVATFEAAETRRRTEYLLGLIAEYPPLFDPAAAILFTFGRGTDETVGQLKELRSTEAALLKAALLARLGHRDLAIEATAGTPPTGEALAAWLCARSAFLEEAGRKTEAGQLRARLETLAGESAANRRLLVKSLDLADRPAEALAAYRPLLEAENAETHDLVHGAELSSRTGDAAGAEKLLERALRVDRLEERAYDGLIALYSSNGALADERKLTATARQLRQNVPSGALIRSLTARELVQRGLLAQAEPQLLSVLDENSESGMALGLLLTVWERSAEINPAMVERAETNIRGRLARRPEAPGLMIALARVLVARGKAEEADSLLAAALDRHPIPELMQQREIVLRDSLKRPEEADQLALRRIESGPTTLQSTVERAQVLLRMKRPQEAAAALEAIAPDSEPLTAEQGKVLLRLLAMMPPESLAGTPAAGVALRHFDRAAAAAGQDTPQVKVARLLLLAAASEDPAVVVESLEASPKELRPTLYNRVIESLGKQKDPTPMLRFLEAATVAAAPIGDELLYQWYLMTCMRGDLADAEHAVRSVKDPGRLLLALLERGGPEVDIPEDETKRRGAVAYAIGVGLNTLERVVEAEAMYRLALTLEPESAWTMNNLGYLVLERGGDLAEADRLITRAHELMPEEASITDSLGWVRYKRGQIEDRTVDGRVIEGAVTLLLKAIELSFDEPHAEIVDHAGDALWRAGRRDEARKHWQQARDAITRSLQLLPPNADQESAFVKVQKADLARIEGKLAKAAEQGEPEVAPFAASR